MDWLDTLIIFFCCVVEVFLIYDYFYNFFKLKVSNRGAKEAYVGIVGAIFVVNIMQNSIINLVLVPVLLWLFITILFDVELGIRLGYFIIAYIVMIGVEFLYVILSNITVGLLGNTGLVPVSEYIWQLLVIKFLNYIIFIILKQISTKSKKRMTNKLFFSYLCVPISTLGTMLTIFYSGIDVRNHVILKVMMTLFFVFMIIGNMILFYTFQKHTEELSKSTRNQIEILYQKAEIERLNKIADLNNNYNEIVHNISHYLKVIGHLAYESKNNEICKIIENLNGKLDKKNIYEYSNNKMLNIILSEYATKAERAGICFDAYVEPGSILAYIQDIDLISIMGNLLDNALLAASELQKKSTVMIRIFMHKNGEYCIIKIVNDFEGELKQVRGRFMSTKKEAGIHGIGLTSISKIAEQYDGYLEHYVIEKKFNVVVVLPV